VYEQIKQLRKSLGMSQEKFAKEIGLTKNFISLVETGQRNLSTQSIKLICQLFNVDVEWLETGKGEMFIQKTENEKIAEFLADVLKAGEKDQRYRFITAISELDENDWNTIQKLAEKLVKK
jgi:transcriptional regulator with XRE-family HTH domain